MILSLQWLQDHGSLFEASLLYQYRVDNGAASPTTPASALLQSVVATGGDETLQEGSPTMSKSQLKKLQKKEFLELRKKGEAGSAVPRGTKMKASVEE